MIMGSSCDPAKHSWKWYDVEIHNADSMCNGLMQDYAAGSIELYRFGTVVKADLCSSRGLAIIKRSHLHRKIKFAHHMIQYQSLDKAFNAKDLEFLAKRTAATKAAFPDRVGTKNKKNEDFFKDAVKRHLPHDELHKIVAHYSEPIYLRLKMDASMAAYDHDLWAAMDISDKHIAVREECYVIALERFLIPHALQGERYPYRFAFSKALEKACTTLDDGPFREHAIDYWNTIRCFDDGVFNKFFNSTLWKDYYADDKGTSSVRSA